MKQPNGDNEGKKCDYSLHRALAVNLKMNQTESNGTQHGDFHLVITQTEWIFHGKMPKLSNYSLSDVTLWNYLSFFRMANDELVN